jgi:hypothetical protein
MVERRDSRSNVESRPAAEPRGRDQEPKENGVPKKSTELYVLLKGKTHQV